MPRRRRDPERLDVNLTPLLDVVLQLIAFFMMLVHFGTQLDAASIRVRLPVAPAGLPGGELPSDQLVVAIDPAGLLRAEGLTLAGPEAAAWWADQAERRRRALAAIGQLTGEVMASGGEAAELPTRVVVRADREAPYGSVRQALATAQEHGFAQFSLVVLRPGATATQEAQR